MEAMLLEKVEARVGGGSQSRVAREVKRVTAPYVGRDGWLTPEALTQALKHWLVGVEEEELMRFAASLAARQVGGRLSVARLAAEISQPSQPVKEVAVCTPPYHSALAVTRPRSGKEAGQEAGFFFHERIDGGKALRSSLRFQLLETAREQFGVAACPDEHELKGRARGILVRRCRAVLGVQMKQSERSHLALAQWCVALRGVASARGLPPPKDADLEQMWLACDRGDYARFASDLFKEQETALSSSSSCSSVATTTPRVSRGLRGAWSPLETTTTSKFFSECSLRAWKVFGHSGRTNSLCFHAPSGKSIYASESALILQDDDQTLLLAKGQVLAVQLHARRPLLALATAHGVQLASLDSCSLTTTTQLGRGLFSHVTCLAFLGDLLAVAGVSQSTTLLALFTLDDGELIADQRIQMINGALHAIAAAPTESKLITVGEGHVAFWDEQLSSKEGKLGAKLARPSVYTCAAYLNDEVALTGADNGRLYVWREGCCLSSIEAHRGPMRCLAVTSNVKIVTGGDDGKLRRWSGLRLTKDAEVSVSKAAISSAVFVTESSLLCATANGSVVGVDLEKQKNKQLRRVSGAHTGEITSLAAHPSEPCSFATTGEDGRVVTWDVRTGRLATVSTGAPGTALEYDDDDGCWLCLGLADGRVCLLDAATLQTVSSSSISGSTTAVRFAPGGRALAVASGSGLISLFFANSHSGLLARAPSKTLRGHTRPVRALDFSLSNGQLTLRSRDEACETLYWALGQKTRLTKTAEIEQIPSKSWRSGSAAPRTTKRPVARARSRLDLYAVARGTAIDLATGPESSPADLIDVHSSAVLDVAFLADDARVVSISKDAIVVWDKHRLEDQLSSELVLEDDYDGDFGASMPSSSVFTSAPCSSSPRDGAWPF